MAFQVSTYSVQNLAKQAQAIDVTTRDGRGGTVIGLLAGANNGAAGSRLTALGNAAAYSNIANDNLAIGYYANAECTTGESNIVIGSEAARGTTLGSRNLMVGHQAGYVNRRGVDNLYMGHNTARTIVDGVGNLIIGHGAGNKKLNNTLFQSQISLGHFSQLSSRGSISVGNRITNTGNYSILMGESISNVADNAILLGNNIINTGKNSFIVNSKSNSDPIVNNRDDFVNINNLMTFSAGDFQVKNSNLIYMSTQNNVFQMSPSSVLINNGCNAIIRWTTQGLELAGVGVNVQSNADFGKDIRVKNDLYLMGDGRTSNNFYISSNLYVSKSIYVTNDAIVTGKVKCGLFEATEILANALIIPGSFTVRSSNTSMFLSPVTFSNAVVITDVLTACNIEACNLYVSQNTLMDGLLVATCPTTLCNTLRVKGNTWFDSSLTVTMASMLSNTLHVRGSTVLDSNLIVSQGSTFCNNVVLPNTGTSLSNFGTTYLQGQTNACNLRVFDKLNVDNIVMTSNLSVQNVTLCNQLNAVGAAVSLNTGSTLRVQGDSTLCNTVVSTLVTQGITTFCNDVRSVNGIQVSFCNASIRDGLFVNASANNGNFSNLNVITLNGGNQIGLNNITVSNVGTVNTLVCSNLVAQNTTQLKSLTCSNDLTVLGNTTLCNIASLASPNLTVTNIAAVNTLNLFLGRSSNFYADVGGISNLTTGDVTLYRTLTASNVTVNSNLIANNASFSNVSTGLVVTQSYFARVSMKAPNSISYPVVGSNYYVLPFTNVDSELGLGGTFLSAATYPCFKAGVSGVFGVQVYVRTNTINCTGFTGLYQSPTALSNGSVLQPTDLTYVAEIGPSNLKTAYGYFTPYLAKDDLMYLVSRDGTGTAGNQNNAFVMSSTYATVTLLNVSAI